MKSYSIALCLLLFCGQLTAQTTVPGGTISTDTIWSLSGSPYIVEGDITIKGSTSPTLTIAAGVEVRCATGVEIRVAQSIGSHHVNYSGGLHAVGTSVNPILFTAVNGNPGGWSGIQFNNSSDAGTANSEFEHCIVELAANNVQCEATGQPLVFQDVVIRDASADGLVLSKCVPGPQLINVELSGNGGFGLLLKGNSLPVHSGVVRSGNGEDRVGYSGTIVTDITLDLAAYSMDVLFTGNTYIYSNQSPTLSLTAGSVLRFAENARLYVGHNIGSNHVNYSGGLYAVGTPSDPILFTSDNGLVGGWLGIEFNTSSDAGTAASQFENCIVELAENNVTCESTTQPAILRNLVIREAQENGLTLEQCIPGPSLENVHLLDNAGFGLSLLGNEFPQHSGLQIGGNGEDRVGYSGTVVQDLTLDLPGFALNVLFHGTTSIYSNQSPTLTLVPGSELRFDEGAWLHVAHNIGSEHVNYSGGMVAVGSSLDPILFTADNGLVGGWKGIQFNPASNTDTASSLFQHCIIELAEINVQCEQTNQPVVLQDLVIRSAEGDGLVLSQCIPGPELQDLELSNNGAYGLSLLGSELPVHVGLLISGNAEDRVGYSGVITQDLTMDLPSFSLPVLFHGNTSIYSNLSPTLTLTAGSELRFASGAHFHVAHNIGSEHVNYSGGLVANGTPLDPIVFTADNGLVGGWEGIQFNVASSSGTASSHFQHCLVELAEVNLQCEQTSQPALLQNLVIQDAATNGLVLSQCVPGPELQDVDLLNNAEHGLLLLGSELPVHNGLMMSGNGEDRVGYSGHIQDDLTLDLAGFSKDVLFTGSTRVYGVDVPVLSLTAGSELRFAEGAVLNIAIDLGTDHDNYRGGLNAVGTMADPVVFLADNGVSGGWEGIRFNQSSDHNGATSSMAYCRIENAVTNIALSNTNEPALEHLLLTGGEVAGLELQESYPDIHNCFFQMNEQAIYLSNDLVTVIGDSTLWTNEFDLNVSYDLYNDGAGDVLARHNAWCPPQGQDLQDRIHDQMDDPTKGLVSYLPTADGSSLNLMISYNAIANELRLEWCSIAGASSYNVYACDTGWPQPGTFGLLANTTDTWLVLDPGMDLNRVFQLRADFP